MSYRGSFTSEYIYDEDLYRKLKEELSKTDRIEFRVNPPRIIRGSDGSEFEIPVISGKLVELIPGGEYVQLATRLQELKITDLVSFTVMSEDGDVHLVSTRPDGEVKVDRLMIDPDWEESYL